jgi:hypothetical protein
MIVPYLKITGKYLWSFYFEVYRDSIASAAFYNR